MSSKRLRNKRMNALRAAYRWQKRLIAGHHYRRTRAAQGKNLCLWDPRGPEAIYTPAYDPPVFTNKASEKNRIRLLWGLKRLFQK